MTLLNVFYTILKISFLGSVAALGILHPKIILSPDYVELLMEDELKFVFMHELAYYKKMKFYGNTKMIKTLIIRLIVISNKQIVDTLNYLSISNQPLRLNQRAIIRAIIPIILNTRKYP